jgi:hypothetical protein
VKRTRLNFACASLVIEYEPSFEGALRTTLGRFSLMSIDDLRVLVDSEKVAKLPAILPSRRTASRFGDAPRSRCRPCPC